MSENLSYVFLDPMTSQCMNLIVYHDLVMVVAVGVMVLVVWFLSIFWYKHYFFGNISNYKLQKNIDLECLWTFIPMVILVVLGYESLMNLCSGEVSKDSNYKVKITGHQWYWSYEYIAGARHWPVPNNLSSLSRSIMSAKDNFVEELPAISTESQSDIGSSSSDYWVSPAVKRLMKIISAFHNALELEKRGFPQFNKFSSSCVHKIAVNSDEHPYLKYFKGGMDNYKFCLWEDGMQLNSFKVLGEKTSSTKYISTMVNSALKKNDYNYSEKVSKPMLLDSMPDLDAGLMSHFSFWLGCVCRLYTGGLSECGVEMSGKFISWDSYLDSLKKWRQAEDYFLKKDSFWVDSMYNGFKNILVKSSLELESDENSLHLAKIHLKKAVTLVDSVKNNWSSVFSKYFSGVKLEPYFTDKDYLVDDVQQFLGELLPVSDLGGVYSFSSDHYKTFVLFDHFLNSWDDPESEWDEEIFGVSYLMSEFSRDGLTTEWLYIPVNTTTEISVTSADVIHSWGVPSFGVKADAIPGRLNRMSVNPMFTGVAFGNCYELCGYGHSVMPINVMIVTEDYFMHTLHKDVISGLSIKGPNINLPESSRGSEKLNSKLKNFRDKQYSVYFEDIKRLSELKSQEVKAVTK